MTASLFLAALSLAVAQADEPPPPATYLLSITGLELQRDDAVDRFDIETWGVDVVAICHIPPGWMIRGGRTAAPDGLIEGRGTHGVTWLRHDDQDELRGLALVRVYGDVDWNGDLNAEGSGVPATFSGNVPIMGYEERGGRIVRLGPDTIRLEPARHCPDPR